MISSILKLRLESWSPDPSWHYNLWEEQQQLSQRDISLLQVQVHVPATAEI